MPRTVVKRVGVNFNQWISFKKNQLGMNDTTMSDTKVADIIIGVELGQITIRRDNKGRMRIIRLI